MNGRIFPDATEKIYELKNLFDIFIFGGLKMCEYTLNELLFTDKNTFSPHITIKISKVRIFVLLSHTCTMRNEEGNVVGTSALCNSPKATEALQFWKDYAGTFFKQ